jgi:hypothetical protein
MIATIAAAVGAGIWAKRHPAAQHTDDSGIAEREWMDAIK